MKKILFISTLLLAILLVVSLYTTLAHLEGVGTKKIEEAYSLWINDLKSKYEIEINNSQWEIISGSNKISDKDLKLDIPRNQLQ